MRIDSRLVAVALPIVFVPLLLVVGLLFRDPLMNEVSACLAAGCFDTTVASNIAPAVSVFLAGTKYEGKINTSERPKEGYLNIYLAKSQLPGRLSTIKCNCAFIGNSTIICDQRFLSSFTDSVKMTRDSFYGPDSGKIFEEQKLVIDQVNERVAKVLALWLIGHEIGHAVLHYYISFERRTAMTEKQELEADKFFIDKMLASATKDERQNVSFAITQFIFSIITATFRTSPNGGAAVIAPSVDGIHPPWLIRALKLGEHMNRVISTDATGNDFYEKLAHDVTVARDGTDIGTFCSALNLREVGAKLQKKRQDNMQ